MELLIGVLQYIVAFTLGVIYILGVIVLCEVTDKLIKKIRGDVK